MTSAAPCPACGQLPPAQKERLVRGPLVLDKSRVEATWNGNKIFLTRGMFDMLWALAERPGVVKSRDQLMDVAYGESVAVDDRTIDGQMKRIRMRLRSAGADCGLQEGPIFTVYGSGYRFEVPGA